MVEFTTPPSDAKELATWDQSERVVVGIITGSVIDLHLELLHRYEDKIAWSLWCAIKAVHEQKDASLRHGYKRKARINQTGDRSRDNPMTCEALPLSYPAGMLEGSPTPTMGPRWACSGYARRVL